MIRVNPNNKYFVADLIERTVVGKDLKHKEAFDLFNAQAETEYERRRYAVFNYKTITPNKFK